MIEIWKDISGYEGQYQVSNLGKIKSLKFGKQIILKYDLNSNGYPFISLSNNNKRKRYFIHRLVAIHFISNPNNLLQVNHIDGNKLNNNVNNLEWCTASMNSYHKYNILGYKSYLLGSYGGLHNCSKKVIQCYLDGTHVKIWDSLKDVERTLGIKATNISRCFKNPNRTAGGFMWKIGADIMKLGELEKQIAG